jgi:glycerol-3-phosphate dehydrogenase (NAD(P)+)
MKKNKTIITVLGAGNMGTAIAQVLASNNNEVRIWNWEGDQLPLEQINKYSENKKYLKGIKLSKNLKACFSIEEALKNSKMVFLVVPSFAIENTIKLAKNFLEKKSLIVDCSKGVDTKNLDLIINIIKKNIDPKLENNIFSISGPAIAGQLAKRNFTFMNIAGTDKKGIKEIKKVMENDFLKLIEIDDLIGIEIAGSFKNAYTIILGICDGLKLDLNTKAIFFTLGLKEIAKLIKVMGGKDTTIFELAGIGDFLGTAFSTESRNRRFGEYFSSGISLEKSFEKVGQTVEGVEAVRCLKRLAKRYSIKMPLNDLIFDILFTKNADIRKKISNFLKKI